MTPAEAALLRTRRPDLTVHRHLDPRFVYLEGKPCPLLRMDGAVATCTVHDIRPYNCRRFGCFRPDPTTEPYVAEPLDLPNLRLGCANLSDRLSNRAVRRAYAKLQRKAQQWALKHGWSQDMTPATTGSNVTFYRMDRSALGK